MAARLTFLEVNCPLDRGYWEHDVRRGTSTFVGEVSFWISYPTLPGLRPFFLNAPLTLEIRTPPGLMPIPATFHIAASPGESSQESDPSEETGMESEASHT